MKKYYEIVFFSLLTLGLLTSGSSDRNTENAFPLNAAWETTYDTTDLLNFIQVDSFRLSILPPSSGVQFYKDGIVFLSMSKYEAKMSAEHISFGSEEAYYTTLKDSIPGNHKIFSPLFLFSYPCEAMTFSSDFNTVYYTKIPKRGKKEKIYVAKFTSDNKNRTGWFSETNPLDFCKDNFSYSHPTLSADEKTLIFASDKEGSVGGMDLFICSKTDDKWSSPENLGRLINTTGNEFFPFLDSENNLYFSSDRLPGNGGYDVFTCKFNGESWDKPKNLSSLINSENDDIAFTMSKGDGNTAFFTRRQKSRDGEMQLFRISLREEQVDKHFLTLSYVFNGKPVAKTTSLTARKVEEIKTEEVKTSLVKPEGEIIKKAEVAVPEKTITPEKFTEKKNISKPETEIKSAEVKVVAKKPIVPVSVEEKDVIVYRVQLLPNTSQKTSGEMLINGTSYKLYDYQYLGVKRYTIGEFSTVGGAAALQKICRQSGYPQSFVVAFKNNTRSLDPKLFK